MNETLIANWNSVVKPEDTVYHLGDFIMGLADNTASILHRLNGHIHLVRGNHDTLRKLAIYEQYPEKITVHDVAYLPYKGLYFVMCHFPLENEAFYDMVVRDNSEVVLCHGHVHNHEPFYNTLTHTFNLSVDVTNFTPVALDNIYEIVKADFIKKGVWRDGSM
jgi:calcineurin-like phosphoesterase family protein